MDAPVPFERQEVERLIALMRDPRYWRHQDPELRRLVRDGLQRLYGRREAPRPIGVRPQPRSAA